MQQARLEIPEAAIRAFGELCSEQGVSEDATSRLTDAVGTCLPRQIAAGVLASTARINEYRAAKPGRVLFLAELLETYGKAVLSLCALHELLTRQHVDSQHMLSAGISSTKTPIVRAAAERIQLEGCIARSAGQRNESIDSTVQRALYRLLGALCLEYDLIGVSAFLRPELNRFLGARSVCLDNKTSLQNFIQSRGGRAPTYAVLGQEGPDHDRRFTCEVRAGARRATGTGRSRKLAEQAAAGALLAELGASVATSPLVDMGAPRWIDQHTVPSWQSGAMLVAEGALRYRFSDGRLLSAALIHPSGRNEQRELSQCVSYGPLATLGSDIALIMLQEHAFLNVERWWDHDIGRLTHVHNALRSDERLAVVARCAGLVQCLILGRGMSAKEPPSSVAAEVTQSTLAAVFLDLGSSLRGLRHAKPSLIEDLFAMLDSESTVEDAAHADKKGILQDVAQICHFGIRYNISSSGKPHDTKFRATAFVSAANESHGVRGPESGSRRAAEAAAASVALDILAALAGGPRAMSAFVDFRDPASRAFARFLLRRLLAVASRGEAGWAYLGRRRLLGMPDIASKDARAVRRAVASLVEVIFAIDDRDAMPLLDAAIACLPDGRARSLDIALAEFTDRLAQVLAAWSPEVEAPELSDSAAVRELRAVSALAGRFGSEAPIVQPLRAALDALKFLRLRKLVLSSEVPPDLDVQVGADTGFVEELVSCALREFDHAAAQPGPCTLRAWMQSATITAIELRAPGVVTHSGSGGFGGTAIQLLAAIGASAEILRNAEDTILIQLVVEPSPASFAGSEIDRAILQYVHQVLRRRGQMWHNLRPFATMAHDLKNLLVAMDARVLQARSDKRNVRRHLAAAEELQDRARVAVAQMKLLLNSVRQPVFASVSVKALLSTFVSELGSRLPAHITLRTHLHAGADEIDGDLDLLRAALENLTKNAIEAMPDAGVLQIEWLPDEHGSVLISIADSGPGIPDHVCEALKGGSAPRSRRSQGSGLGLISVARIARLHGGTFEIARATQGTIATLTLPARDAMESTFDGGVTPRQPGVLP